ncbi:zinc ABC transporter ATP-binding protein ZnuC [Saccharophagus sp. K07]|uniref:zinc ABC transporter ATP-binding protein ZnuC n=1 Tax=Saccharophagus sp. K07 TaxID=2283636 RepID=UPI001652750C|nr:zinc ABC transporter ATP-binding protein ZnuC [Saccharophagus sp. K07]MBC6906188.1 zinc ABC transporter ATP-binding protein ZnuC [Saccharophagus sp. K07]
MNATSSPLIACENVSWRRNGVDVLQGVSFHVAPREIVTLIGPNGAGKTSLVNLAIGLLEPTQGRVVRQERLRLGYMPQHLRFDNNLPVTVERFLRLASSDKKVIHHYSERLGIAKLHNQQLQNLSGGELQRVLLTRAVLRKPELLVLDEPTQGVDVIGQAELYRHISELRDELGCGVLMVSHDLHLVMAKTDTVICLNRHICCQGAPESVARHPEYLQMFGKQAEDIAIYTHHHDHEHNLHGDVVPAAHHHHDHSNCQHHHS